MKELNLTYLDNEEHTHLDACHGITDILDMALIIPSLKSKDIRFSIDESLGGDHLPTVIFIDRLLQRNKPIISYIVFITSRAWMSLENKKEKNLK